MYEAVNTTENHTTLVGWQSSPDGRGTYDILQSCVGTIILLCWSSVCANVPPLGSRGFAAVQGKLSLFWLAIMIPDAVLWIALSQLCRAWEDRKEFRARNCPSWGLRECFFVNMGGFFIHFSGQDPFPVDCTQLRYLVDMDYLELPTISAAEIESRNKSDRLARSITIAQVFWYTVSTLARVAQGLPITSLELTTLSLVLIMVFTAAAWWHKPMDISHPILATCDVPFSTVLSDIPDRPEGASRNYGWTPLSFHGRQETFLSQAWASYVNILRAIHRRCRSSKVAQDPQNRAFGNAFPSIELTNTSSVAAATFASVIVQAYGAIYLCAWNSYFPTATERVMWRVSSIIGSVYGIAGVLILLLNEYGHAIKQMCCCAKRRARKNGRGKDRTILHGAEGTTKNETNPAQEITWIRKFWQRIRPSLSWLRRLSNLSTDPSLNCRLRLWIPTTLVCMVYGFARVFILTEDFISLRQQPPNAYKTVSWTKFSLIF